MNDELWAKIRAELMAMGMRYRMDWSDFDGRQLLQEVTRIVKNADDNKCDTYFQDLLKEMGYGE